jgi:hypothetical protein
MPKSDHPRAKTALAMGNAAAPSLPLSASPSVLAELTTRPTPLPKPCVTHNNAGWGGGVPLAHPDRNCRECLWYLTRALDSAGLHPTSLLRALGVIMQSSGGSIAKGGDVIPLRAVVGHWLLDIGHWSWVGQLVNNKCSRTLVGFPPKG